jgi:hypothetical protein
MLFGMRSGILRDRMFFWTISAAATDEFFVCREKFGDRPLKTAVLFIAVSGFLLMGAQTVSVLWDVKRHPECSICGMDRQRYAQAEC